MRYGARRNPGTSLVFEGYASHPRRNPHLLERARHNPYVPDYVVNEIARQIAETTMMFVGPGDRRAIAEAARELLWEETGERPSRSLVLYTARLARLHHLDLKESTRKEKERRNPVSRSGGGVRWYTPRMGVASANRKWDAGAARKRLKAFALKRADGNRRRALQIYSKFFLYKDPGHTGFTAYKLPFADIVGGAPKIVPHAVSAIHGVLDSGGGRRMKGTSARQIRELRRLTTELYRKIGKRPPRWDKKATTVATGRQRRLL